ncbi:MAG: L-histidine N(alpha)-methyltransferase [Acidimicrobiia bacterium]|nr:L-histidine N(alpha)-methyltransferase [Acidimicrobiia bacterium]
MTTAPVEPIIDVHLDPTWAIPALRADVEEGLTSMPKELPPKWFYDERGSDLFDEITRLPEYYPTRREREILTREAATIAAVSDADTLVELGSGTSDKTRVLLDAMWETRQLDRFVPFDVSEETLRSSAKAIAHEYPGLRVHGVVGDFEHHLATIPAGGRRLMVLLGGTIGNFTPVPRRWFIRSIAEAMEPGDHLLLGTDLVKDPDRLEAAYDDAAGVTAAFNRNVLYVINGMLDADFDPQAFAHRSVFDRENEWIEMRLVSETDQRVHVAGLGLVVDFAAGEEMRTEVSAKFRVERVERELAEADLRLVHWWTDAAGDFGVSLAVRD